MQIKLWGVRGSLPSPLNNQEYSGKLKRILKIAAEKRISETDDLDSFIQSLPDELRYVFGGDTTCVTVKSSSGKLYIIDCGTGVRRLGNDLMEGDCAKGKGVLNIMITHNHWDHIQGLPFFRPIYVPGNVLNFYSPYKNQKEILERQMTSPYFPATFEGTASEKNYILIDNAVHEPIMLEEDLKLSIHPLKHPQGCFAYKFEQNGKIFIFATDTEFTGEAIEKAGDKNFFRNADLLVLDSQYTLDEAFLKVDWGHTSYTMAVNCAINWNVKKLIMTHHEPAYSDDILQENYLLAVEHAEQMADVNTEILLGREGMVFDL
ncbi:MAG TPA: MBL fold metallo-hydrolase [Spirochaetota bacterium]|nr:MBL fold metallo-hydrolase [Spirochaetota bacterium]HPF05950.1 MBL fold metallo-hydrolase [Spirochaetota bacterium]HPJ42446.1 MBL fold metallo-hydrolase [Spirochaetota bacterium]HPR37224.1 MBL fold metallo-hydrolase [Spirochaetota bacterium]HRX46428.1 MBL fold metallo-hydrolase [Spirochaetota bacterium]